MDNEQTEVFNCEGCGIATPDKDLTNVMAGVPLDIFAVCPECLVKLENGEL
jgi:predicted  nucleic acid-binding Zn-ribbon protein